MRGVLPRGGAAGVVAFLVVIGLVVVPPALANLRTQVASAQDPLVIGAEAAAVVDVIAALRELARIDLSARL